MASTTIAFSVNDATLDKIEAFQKQRKRKTISIGQFCKELVLQTVNKDVN